MSRLMTLVLGLTLAGAHPILSQEEPKPEEEQEPKDPPEEQEELTYAETVIVTASRVEQQLINAPATVSVVTSEVIENSPAQNYGDLLRSVPGVNVAQTSARDINIVTRGATSTLSTSQLALLDGRSIYQDFFGFVAWDFLPVNTEEIAQIEVIRGPASAVWGANAMTGVVNVISKTPRELDGTTLTLGYGGVNRDVPGNELGTGETYHLNLTHAQALNDRWAYKVSAGVFGMDAFARPTGRVPIDPVRGTGGGAYPPYANSDTTQPKLDVRVDYDFPDGNQKLIFGGGFAGTQGIIHTGIGPFDIQSGTVLGYGKVNYSRGNWRVNFFTNLLDGEAPALLALGPDGRPISFLFDNKTYDVEVGNSAVVGTRHIVTYGGNFRYNAFDLSIAPRGDNRTEGGFYLQDEIFLSEHFRWLIGARADGFSVIDKFVFSPRTTFMIKPTPDQAIRFSYNRAFRAPSFVNSFLDVAIIQAIDLGLINPALAGRQYAFPVAAVGNEDLDEESMTAYEIGYTGTLQERYTLNAAWYLNQTSNNIFFTQSGSYTSQNPPPGWPLPPVVLDLLNLAGRGLPSNFTYLNFEGVRDWGIELGIDARVTSDVNLFANYSWQAEPDPDDPDEFSELNVPPANRFNLGANYSRGIIFGNLSVNFTDSAFWTDVLDARYHGPTESYTMVNGGFGVRLAEDRVTAAIKFVNLNNDDAQQHIFGDIIKRQIVGEVKYRFR
ncbi:MAG: TonB-dependent receptor plug domain-containing protein [Vicinamibacteria bacterium]